MKIPHLLLLGLLLSAQVRADFGFVWESAWTAGDDEIRTLAFGPDGTWVVVAVSKHALVFDLKSSQARQLGELTGPRKEVLGVAISPDGKMIALADASGALTYTIPASRTTLATIAKAHSGRASAVAFSANGEYVISGGEDGKVRVWTPKGSLFAELSKGAKHQKEVIFVAGVPPDRRVISVGLDKRVILWQLDTQQAIRPTEVDMDVRSVAFGETASWSSGSKTCKETPIGHVPREGMGGMPGRPSTSPSRPTTAPIRAGETQSTDRVRLVDVESGMQLHELEGMEQDLDTVGATPDGRFVASGGSGRSLSIWDTVTGRRINTIPSNSPLTAVAFSPDGQRMALGASDGSLSLYRLTGSGQ